MRTARAVPEQIQKSGPAAAAVCHACAGNTAVACGIRATAGVGAAGTIAGISRAAAGVPAVYAKAAAIRAACATAI